MRGVLNMTMEPSDVELVERARRGEDGAFDALFARHYARVFNFALKMQGGREEAADIAQTAFVRAYEGLGHLRDGQAFLGWVYRIVVNLVRDRARSARRKPWVALTDLFRHDDVEDEPAALADATLDPGAIVTKAQRDAALLEAIRGLPLEFREPLVLYYVEGLDVADVARATGAREGTVKSRLGRARKRLRTAMQPWLEESE